MQKQQKNAHATNANRQQLKSLYELQRKLIPIDPRFPIERQQLVDLHLQDLHWHWKDYDTCGNLIRMVTARFHQVIQQPDFYLEDDWKNLSLEIMNILHLSSVLKEVKKVCELADNYLRESYPEDYQDSDIDDMIPSNRYQDR